jgi:hypothetical protein
MTAGSPALNVPVTRTEARIEAALRVAREALAADPQIDPEAPFVRGAALRHIVRILEDK